MTLRMDSRDTTRDAARSPDPSPSPETLDRLDSWKDVAAYLRRDVSTVQRWERREGLPVHRQQHDKLGSVFAFRHELDAWREARSRRGEPARTPDATVGSILEPAAPPVDLPAPADTPVEVARPSPANRPSRRLPGAALGALGLAALGALAWVVSSRSGPSPAPPPADTRVTRLTDRQGLEEAPAISPDGRSVAFTADVAGKRQVFVQLVTGGTPLQLTREPVDHDHPRWVPDSRALVFFSPGEPGERQGHLWEVDALGGGTRRITASMGGADVNTIDGRLAFFRLDGSEIQLVTAPADGSPGHVVARFPPTTYYLSPRWSPDGRWIAFQRGDSIRFDAFAVPATGGEARQLTHDNTMMSGLAWLPDSSGIVVSSSRGGTMPYLPTMGLWSVPLDTGRLQQLTSGESSYTSPDVSKTGAVFVSRMRQQSDLWKFPVDGTPIDNVQRAVRLTSQTGQVLTPTAGPDDREVAYLSDSGGHANLWVTNLAGGEPRRLTDERDPNVAVGVPVWSPTGPRIAFVYSRGNQGLTFGVWSIDSDGSNLRSVANPGLGPAWSHDGRWLYYSTRGGGIVPADIALKKIPAEGGTAVTVTRDRLRNVIGSDGTTLYYTVDRPLVDGVPEFEIRAASPEDAPHRVLARIPATRVPTWQIVNPALSRDGRWLAQALTDGFSTNIWALSTSDGSWRQLTDFGARATFIARRVSWSSDGRFIFAAVAEGDADIVRLDGLATGTAPRDVR